MTARSRRILAALVTTSALGLSVAAIPSAAQATGNTNRTLFIKSAVEDTNLNRVTLPAYHGRTHEGRSFRFVVTEASSKRLARNLGVNFAPKLANTIGTNALQQGYFKNGQLIVEATVDFAPERVVVPGPGGFPPEAAKPGAVGEAGYSPLVQLPGGTVINASHVANATGYGDKVLSLTERRVTLQETEGFYEGDEVYYVSFDASAPDIAALEGVTYAPNLNAAPGLGSNDRGTSARSGIVPFVNGQTGIDNPNRQGLGSALMGEGDPLNVVETEATDNDYSPLWDMHATAWVDPVSATLQTDFDDIRDLAEDGVVTGPGGAAWGAIGVIVNCPLISIEES
jgi:hypothetical protein